MSPQAQARTPDVDYLTWNAAVADVVFTQASANKPVYLDMDPEVLELVGSRVGVAPADVESGLCEATGALVGRTAGAIGVFREFDRLVGEWERDVQTRAFADSTPAPPVIALLAVFVLAAERMGRRADGFKVGQHAYYEHLLTILGVPAQAEPAFKAAFRSVSERYWEVLARWLDAAQGRRGLPSANAFGHRYVGLPISQALVRRAEREQLTSAFADAGLLPGEVIDPVEMMHLLDGWLTSTYKANKRFRHLWCIKSLRGRIAEIAVQELESWKGSVTGDGGAEAASGRLRLLGWWGRGRLLRRTAEIGIGAPAHSDGGWRLTGYAEESTADGDHPKDGLTRLTLGSLGLDVGAALESRLSIVDGSGAAWSRTPSVSALLAYDEASEVYVEAQRATYGHVYWLLVRSAVEKVAQDTERFLTDSGARYTLLPRDASLPNGWTLYTDLRLGPDTPFLEPQQYHRSLHQLIPQHRVRIELAGGLRLPGSGDRYSASAPPRVVSVEGTNLAVDPVEPGGRAEAEQVRAFLDAEPCDLPLPQGDFLLTQVGESADSSHHRRTLRLRTPASEDRGTLGALGHPVVRSLHDLTCGLPLDAQLPTIHGAMTHLDPVPVPGHRPQWSEWSYFPRTDARTTVSLPSASDVSCLWDGHHRVLVEHDTTGDLQVQRYTCCGRVLLTPKKPRDRMRRRPQTQPRRPTSSTTDAVNDDAVRDALIYLAVGTSATAQRVLTQAELGSAPVTGLLNDLAATAFLDVEREPGGRVLRWSVCPPALSETETGLLATGGWTSAALRELAGIVSDEGGQIERLPIADGGTVIIRGVAADDLLAYEDTMKDVEDAGPAAIRLIERLPPLSRLADATQRQEVPARAEWEAFCSPKRFGWLQVRRPDTEGLFRASVGWSRQYLVRNARDLADETAIVVPSNVGKHVAAAHGGHLLVRYEQKTGFLEVPLGARLPGLFERAACLASGRLPALTPDRDAHRYTEITTSLAEQICGRLR